MGSDEINNVQYIFTARFAFTFHTSMTPL